MGTDRTWADVPDWVKTESLEAPLVTDEQAGDIACTSCLGAGIANHRSGQILPAGVDWVRCPKCAGSGKMPKGSS
jgi:DnaJ-class molecular chaperone